MRVAGNECVQLWILHTFAIVRIVNKLRNFWCGAEWWLVEEHTPAIWTYCTENLSAIVVSCIVITDTTTLWTGTVIANVGGILLTYQFSETWL
jgi:hypothetical protein